MLTFDIAGEKGLEEGLEVHDSIVVLQLFSERTFQKEEVAWGKKRNCLLRLAFLWQRRRNMEEVVSCCTRRAGVAKD